MADAQNREVVFNIIQDFITKHPDKSINVYYRFRKDLFLPLNFQGSKPKLKLNGRLISLHHAAKKHFGLIVGSYDIEQNPYINFSFLYSEVLQVPEFRSVKFNVNNKGFCRKLNYFAREYFYRHLESPTVNSDIVSEDNLSDAKNDITETSPSKTVIVAVDYVDQAIRNEEIGSAGEDYVIQIERNYLRSIGRLDLINKEVKQPDGYGYDILSFDNNGRAKFIEVKTTTSSFQTEFFITENEMKFMQRNPDSYFIYRVFNFNIETKQGILCKLYGGDLDELDFLPKVFSCIPPASSRL